MEIQVLSKVNASKFSHPSPWACISVSTNENEWPTIINENRIGLLQLHFADVSSDYIASQYEWNNIPVFSDDHAVQVLNFYKELEGKIDLLLVHCEAGISRSAGIAAALALITKGSDEPFFNRPYVPNTRVYKKIIEEAVRRNYLN